MTPKTVSFSGELLEKMKKENTVSDEVLNTLREAADKWMGSPSLNVVARKMKAPTGNPHDYASIGSYWWPNPDTTDGLPYVRRDGEVTPAAKDQVTHRNMADKVFDLAMAAYYFEDEKYAREAEKALYDWHLNPETYMTPHATYAQSIPGICDGRGIGIIDFVYSYKVFDAAAILEALGWIAEDTMAGLMQWYRDFTDWLLTSENGLTEECELNNHGTFYDVLILSAAIFTGREALINKICTTSYERRFIKQTEENGAQPLELARTMGMHYSLANARALFLIANMARRYGHDEYWGIDPLRGVCIARSTVDYIYPYAKDPESFPYQEINYSSVPPIIQDLLWILEENFPEEGYAAKAKEFGGACPVMARPGK